MYFFVMCVNYIVKNDELEMIYLRYKPPACYFSSDFYVTLWGHFAKKTTFKILVLVGTLFWFPWGTNLVNHTGLVFFGGNQKIQKVFCEE